MLDYAVTIIGVFQNSKNVNLDFVESLTSVYCWGTPNPLSASMIALSFVGGPL